jgi:hypothetical protein
VGWWKLGKRSTVKRNEGYQGFAMQDARDGNGQKFARRCGEGTRRKYWRAVLLLLKGGGRTEEEGRGQVDVMEVEG